MGADYLNRWRHGYVCDPCFWGTEPSRLIRAVPPALPGERALDLGCGQGRNVRALANLGYTVTAVDTLPEALRALSTNDLGISAVNGDAVDVLGAVAPDSVAVIFAIHLVQHLNEARVAMLISRAHVALRPGGVLALSYFVGPPSQHPDYVANEAWLADSGAVPADLKRRGFHIVLNESAIRVDRHGDEPEHFHAVEYVIAMKTSKP